ncbi:hypothetical protein KAK06_11055 [Ideonella sp. 4Y11]|uniref:Uncharacterized protein n=1 Tax=Ideonella aquatica TaxID=2824119 RepID=A0A941BK30_9BURK|nr:hypothetical protein [Ideonella aquatica]MBQ0959488.1 hypothetical protein [Ideonella aquatica]
MNHRFTWHGLALAAAAALALPAAAQQMLTSKVNADDQFKIFLSDNPTVPGIQFSQGLGWGATYTGTALPPPGSAGQKFYLNIWVGDIASSLMGLLGEFKLTGVGTCVFANNATSLRTLPNKLWRVTKPLPPSVFSPTPAGYPAVPGWNNDLPFYVQPTLIPISWQMNSAGTLWPPMPGVAGTAHWINSPVLLLPPAPPVPAGTEVWFQTLIRC